MALEFTARVVMLVDACPEMVLGLDMFDVNDPVERGEEVMDNIFGDGIRREYHYTYSDVNYELQGIDEEPDPCDEVCNHVRLACVQREFVYDVSRPYFNFDPTGINHCDFRRSLLEPPKRVTVDAVVLSEEVANQGWPYLELIRECQKWLGFPEAKLYVVKRDKNTFSIQAMG